jgi:hypothetical protein
LSSSSNESERKETAEIGEETMPLPVDAKVIFLGGIFFILFLAALYALADIVWPLVLAFVLSCFRCCSSRRCVCSPGCVFRECSARYYSSALFWVSSWG